MVILIRTAGTHQVNVLVIAECRSASKDRGIEDLHYRDVQAFDLTGVEIRRGPVGAEPSSVQDFIGIDIADSCNHVLIQQQRFQSSL